MIDNFEEKDKNGIERIYIVLEYLENKNLFEYFYNNQKTFPEISAKYLFSKIVKGVQEIHNAGFCHLDLKLENILLDYYYNPIICDFGFSMNTSEKIKRFFYSPGYAPKEIFERKSYDGKMADIFSLGVVLFYIVTNKSIFFDKNQFCEGNNPDFDIYIDKDPFYKLIIEGNIKKYWDYVDVDHLNLSEEFKKLIIKMIAYKPKDRITIDEIITHSWLKDVNNLTDIEKYALDTKVKNELQEILNIKKKSDEKNSTNENYLSSKNKIKKCNTKSDTDQKEDIFTQNFELKNIDEDNLDMKYYFKINGSINPRIFMNDLYDKLYEIEKYKGDDNRTIYLEASEQSFEIDIQFQSDNDKIKEKLKEKGFEEEDFKDFLEKLDLTIRVKLFKAQNGYLIKVFRKKGTYEDFNYYLEKIMILIKDLFESI